MGDPPLPSADELHAQLRQRLGDAVPEPELGRKARLAHEIHRLKRERNAVILGHNYMEPALFHSIPDFVGDSLELSRRAARTDKDLIVFCGVRFMAETAKILNPGKTVLLPSLEAGCSLAAGITADDVRRLRRMFPGVPVVTYVNTYADVKAESDVCCTSGNAAAVVKSVGGGTVMFLPDEYLAQNVGRELGKEVVFPGTGADAPAALDVAGRIIGWRGRCEVHEQFTPEHVAAARERYPDAVVLAHPECRPDVVAAADFSGSTSAMIRFVETGTARRYLLLTECAMADNIRAARPDKELLRLCPVRCPHMNRITLENTLEALRDNRHVIDVPEDVRVRAARAVERMIAIG
jgi:quinolinate synthase